MHTYLIFLSTLKDNSKVIFLTIPKNLIIVNRFVNEQSEQNHHSYLYAPTFEFTRPPTSLPLNLATAMRLNIREKSGLVAVLV